MKKVFFISDTHFGHEKVLHFSPCRGDFDCISEHDEMLIDKWNSKVNKRDSVWHLGDVIFNSNKDILHRLNGYKRLVMGNHDSDSIFPYFDRVYGAAKYKDIVLTHIPVHESQRTRFKKNIHGHLHNKNIDDDFYINVSCEQIDCTPVTLDEIDI